MTEDNPMKFRKKSYGARSSLSHPELEPKEAFECAACAGASHYDHGYGALKRTQQELRELRELCGRLFAVLVEENILTQTSALRMLGEYSFEIVENPE